jgi:hypothetical protein
MATDRSGLLGPTAALGIDVSEDFQAHRAPGSSQLGPSLGQGRDILGGQPFGETFEEALPANPLYRRWVNPTEVSPVPEDIRA